jgi:hypothetical protein
MLSALQIIKYNRKRGFLRGLLLRGVTAFFVLSFRDVDSLVSVWDLIALPFDRTVGLAEKLGSLASKRNVALYS